MRAEFERRVQALPAGSVFVYDVPLLFETMPDTGDRGPYDLTIVVSAPADLRYERVRERNGWSREEFTGRESAQMPLREKENRADLIIENTAGVAELETCVEQIYRQILTARDAASEQEREQ